jgi:hypothetical protein
MMKKMFGIGGEEGVDTLPPTKKAFENLFTIYDEFQKLLETSAYIAEDENGRKIRQMFPMSNKSDHLTMLKEKFKEEKRHYINLQNIDMEKHPWLKAEYFSNKSRKKVYLAIEHAEANCWPNSSDDDRVKIFTQNIDQNCSLSTLRKNFDVQIQKYGEARCDFENKVIKIEGVINVLEAFDGLDDIMTPVIEKTKREFIEGFKSALETARIFNNVCIWSMTMLPHPEYAGNYSWFSQWSLHNKGQIEQRTPWHQTVNFQEAVDVFQKVERLIEAGTTAQQIGIELDIEK